MNKKKRQICIVVNSRANYGRIKSVMTAIRNHPKLDLQLIVGASALLSRFGNVYQQILDDGFEPLATVYSIVEGGTPTTMAKSTGMGIIELATQFENLKPDAVLTVADRFETMATAVAASYMNIPLVHTQGGEVTGSIDESVRHAVSKLAHLHFPATQLAADNLIRMGEDPDQVHLTGCPSIDMIADLDLALAPDTFEKYQGTGPDLDPSNPYLAVLQHPVTTEYGRGMEQINESLNAISRMNVQTAWLWPNVDAGSDDVAKGLRMYREHHPKAPIHFYRHFSIEDYARLINNCVCLVGNSSSALREGAFLGVPAVNIGSRQKGREHGDNIMHAPHSADRIEDAIRAQMSHGKYARQPIFGDGQAGARIAEILSDVDFRIQKRLHYGQ